MTVHAGEIAGPVEVSAVPHPEPAPGSPRPRRLHVLDLLRFGAAVSVLGYHVFVDNRGAWGANTIDLFGRAVVNVFRYGWMGVEFFFVISGFVICMSCWGRSVSDFFVSRVTRLMPAYVFAVLITSAVLAVWPLAAGRPQPSHVLINATMLQTFVGIPNIDAVYWTLFVELKFYLLFALVVHFGLTYRRVVLFCLLWLVAALFAEHTGFAPLAAVVEPRFAPYFITGIALYLIQRFGPNLLLWAIVGVSSIVGLIELGRRVAEQNANRPKPVVSFEVALPVMVLFLAVMAAVALGWFSWLRWSGLTVLGALTYPVYLLHMQIGRVALNRVHDAVPPGLLLVGLLSGVLLLAYLTHRLVERPAAAALRRRLRESFAQIRSEDSRA